MIYLKRAAALIILMLGSGIILAGVIAWISEALP